MIWTSTVLTPLAATEYVEKIYKYYWENEETSCVRPDYMSSQGDINEKMRAILIDWLIEVHYKFDMMDETLFLTVNIIDRFLEKEVVQSTGTGVAMCWVLGQRGSLRPWPTGRTRSPTPFPAAGRPPGRAAFLHSPPQFVCYVRRSSMFP